MIEPGSTVTFFGDSVTDCGRRDDPDGLGSGYVRLLAADLPQLTVRNAGIGGNRVINLQSRLDEDVLTDRPDVVSILIGINETWRRFDSDDPTSAEVYESGYRDVLTRITEAGARLVLLEPFVLPVTAEQATDWQQDLQPKIEVVHRLAEAFEAPLVPLDVELNKLAAEVGAAALAEDGVHPTERGHAEIARLWRQTTEA